MIAPDPVPVSVDGVAIPETEIAAEMQHHPAGSPEAARTAAAQALVVRRLLLAAAADRGLHAGPADAAGPGVEMAIERLLAAEISAPIADEATCRRFYDRNPARFRSPDLYDAQHILLAADPADAAARAEARARAAVIIAIVTDAPDRFGALARAESACPSRAQDGHLGQFTAGTTVAELETFLAALEQGQLCPVPVETRYGYHVLRLLHRAPGRTVPFDAARERIAAVLTDHARTMATRQYLIRLAAAADVRGVDLPRGDGPLLQ